MYNLLKIFLIVFFSYVNCSIAKDSIVNSFRIKTLTMDDGLSQGSNYFKYEDSKGFMWITGNDAINRYDGKTVKVYNKEKYFKNCPILQQGYGFTEDTKCNIYIGSIRGLYIYVRNEDRFILKNIFPNEKEQVAMPFGYYNGKIWCFNKNYNIVSYDVEKGIVKHEFQLNVSPIKSIHIYELSGNSFYFHYPFIDHNGIIWITTEKNVYTLNLSSKEITTPLSTFIYPKQSKTFFCCHYDKTNNHIYWGTQHSIIDYDIKNKLFQELFNIGSSKISIVASITTNENMLIFREGNQLVFLSKNEKNKLPISPVIVKKYNRSYGFTFDKSNRLWLCDDGNGQVIFNFNQPVLNKEPNDNLILNFFENMGANRFVEMPDSTVSIPNYLNGCNIMVSHDNKKRTFQKHDLPFLKDIFIYECTTDKVRKGFWLISEFHSNINQKKTISFIDQHYRLKYNIQLPKYDTLGIAQDIQVLKDGSVLCSFETGLYWINIISKTLEKAQGDYLLKPFKINQLNENKIAVSYLNGHMNLIKIEKDNLLQFEKAILPGVQSFYIQVDTIRKCYWTGTNQGVYLLDNNFQIIKKFDISTGLAGTYIYGLLLDNDGNVYCSHQHGLSTINAETHQIINFDKSDGIQGWDYNNRSFLKTSDGTLFFGGNNGFNYFKPPLDFTSYYKPEVYVDEILVNNITYNSKLNADIINKLDLDYKQNNISIKAIVKDLLNADQRQIIYRITEKETTWNYLPNNSTLRFTNLAPDDYTLELGTYDKYSNKELIQKKIIISIASPFYYKSWFWILSSIVATALVFIFINNRKQAKHKVLKDQQIALEKQRAKITADLHDDIGATLSSLQINSAVANKLIASNTSKAQHVLNKIEDQSRELADKIGDIIWSMKPGKDEFMTMSSRIKTFANDILSSTSIHYTIQIDPKVDTLIQDISVRKNIVLITKEAINNAAKFSKASELEIRLNYEHNNLVLEISDNGLGFELENVKGNGIRNIKKRTEELHGNLEIKSSLNLGCHVRVTIPCP